MSSPEIKNNDNDKKDDNSYLEGCLSCGCLIAVFCGAFMAVSWAWHYHWLFGLFMIIFLLGLR